MDEHCGAWQVGDDHQAGEIEFRVFFPAGPDPRVRSIRVAGDFQQALGGVNWDFPNGLLLSREQRQDPRGVFWSVRTGSQLPAGYYQYKYMVEFDGVPSRIVTDPCARYGGLDHQNSGVVVGGSSPAQNVVRPLPNGRRPPSELVVYEVMLDDFTLEYRRDRAPAEAMLDKLDDLVALGVTAVEFMPWTAWRDSESDWGYGPVQYFAVEARYVDSLEHPEEKLSWLKQLVTACHDRGLHVIMDGVFNHVSPDFPYPMLYADPSTCPFVDRPFGGTFPGLLDLDFAEPITGQLIAEVCAYWIDVFGIDGIRFDNTTNFYVPGDPLHGLPQVLQSAAQAGGPNFSLTIEHLDLSAAQVTNTTAATSFWDDSLYHLTFEALRAGGIGSDLLNALNNRRFLADAKAPTLYLTNHDHTDAAWQAGVREGTGAVDGWWRLQPFLVALFTSTGVPLVKNGQEFGEEYPIPENDKGTSRRLRPRPLRWKLRQDAIGSTLTALHTRLATLREQHPALRSASMYPGEWQTWQTQFDPQGLGVDVGRQLAVYHRQAQVPGGVETVVVALNFSDGDQLVAVPFPAQGLWEDGLAGFDGGPGWNLTVTGLTAAVPVGSHWGRVLIHHP